MDLTKEIVGGLLAALIIALFGFSVRTIKRRSEIRRLLAPARKLAMAMIDCLGRLLPILDEYLNYYGTGKECSMPNHQNALAIGEKFAKLTLDLEGVLRPAIAMMSGRQRRRYDKIFKAVVTENFNGWTFTWFNAYSKVLGITYGEPFPATRDMIAKDEDLKKNVQGGLTFITDFLQHMKSNRLLDVLRKL